MAAIQNLMENKMLEEKRNALIKKRDQWLDKNISFGHRLAFTIAIIFIILCILSVLDSQ